MMKNMFDNLKTAVANTRSADIKMIDISKLHESAENFFELSGIEELAESILGQGGVLENLIVTPIGNDEYEIISGHRRRAAVQYLIDHGENISHYLPCLVQNYNDKSSKLIDLVLMNTSARQLTDAELMQSYETINDILKEKKNLGEKFGKTREKLAEILSVSPAQVGKMQNVEKNAIEPIKEAVKSGDISISTANEIAKLDKESQKKIAKTDLSEVKPKEVKKKETKKKAADKKVDTNSNFTDVSEKSEEILFSDKSEVGTDTNINFSEPEDDITKWESAIKGYVLLAAEQADFSKEQQNALLGGMIKVLSLFDKAAAEKKYNNR